MDADEAIDILHCHAGNIDDDADWSKFDSGFVGMLRPYSGLLESNFHELMVALYKAAPVFQQSGKIDNKLAHSLWSICSSVHTTATREGSALRRNNLITDSDLKRLTRWVDIFEWDCQMLIMGIAPHIVIESYADYLNDHPKLYFEADFILGLLEQNLREVDGSSDPTVCIDAVGVFGARARHLLPLIESLSSLNYSYYEPYDSANHEVNESVTKCLARIKESS